MQRTLTDFERQSVKNLIHQIKHVMKSMSETEVQSEILFHLKHDEIPTFTQFLSLFDE